MSRSKTVHVCMSFVTESMLIKYLTLLPALLPRDQRSISGTIPVHIDWVQCNANPVAIVRSLILLRVRITAYVEEIRAESLGQTITQPTQQAIRDDRQSK